MKILIAEDDRISQLLIQLILEADGGHTLTIVSDGEEAWQKLLGATEPFDLCLLDIRMPRLDGLGLVTRMRADEHLKAIPVILCTAFNDRTTVQKAALLSVSQYIVKPYTRANIIEKIHLVHGHAAGAQPLEDSNVVCARLGVDTGTYRKLLESLVQAAAEWTQHFVVAEGPAGRQGLQLQLNGLKGSALSLGARGLAAQFRVAEEILERTGPKDREKPALPDNVVAAIKGEIDVLQKHLQGSAPA